MAHVHVGFHDQRSCNRILKPPGGGTSNIFGTDRIPEVEKVQSVQETLQTETSVTKRSVVDQNGTAHTESSTEVNVEQHATRTDENGISHPNGHTDHSLSKEVVSSNQNGSSMENGAQEVANKIEEMSIQESKHGDCKTNGEEQTTSHYETKTVISSSAEVKSSRISTSSTIADVLNQDGVAVKAVDVPKQEKPKTPHRVPPGGYSSGLW